MNQFIYENPTKVRFGVGVVEQLNDEIRQKGSRILFLYGSGSIKNNGVYDAVVNQLTGIEYVEYGGVVGNPRLSHAEKAVELVRKHNIDLILAVGGGSVIDEAKAIAAGSCYDDNLWDFYAKKAVPQKALPIISVLTLPATASEMNGFSVMTHDETQEKCAIGGAPLLNPVVSFLDPSFTTSLSLTQTAFAAADIISHCTEGYFTTTVQELFPQDEMIEGLVRSVREAMKRIRNNPENIEARAALMWTATLGWNGTVQMGIPGMGLPCHALEMPLSGIYDIAHGAGLSILTPAWMKAVKDRHGERLIRFGKRCLGIQIESVEAVAEAMEELYREIGAPLRLRDVGVEEVDIERLTTDAFDAFASRKVEGYDRAMIESIYRSIL